MRAHLSHNGGVQGLKDYIYQTLCQYEKLEVGVFPMTHKILLRRATPCGIYFCLHGPRNVKFTAIWDAERNTVLFYGAGGERFMKLQLPASVGVESMAT